MSFFKLVTLITSLLSFVVLESARATEAPALSSGYQEQVIYQGSEVALLTPWTVFQNSLLDFLKSRQTFAQSSTNTVWNFGQFQFQISGLKWQASTAFTTVAGPTPNQFQLSSQNLNIALQVDHIAIDQYLEQIVSGVAVRVHVQADCGSLQLTQAAAQAQGRVTEVFSPTDISSQLDQFQLSWAPGTWTVSTPVCTGAGSFAQALQSELLTQLKTATILQPTIEQMLATQLQTQTNSIVQKLKAPTAIALPVSSYR